MSGSGRVTTDSGSVDTGMSWSARAEDVEGASPEELIAAAHATCVSMALSHALSEDGHAPTRLDSSATADVQERGAARPSSASRSKSTSSRSWPGEQAATHAPRSTSSS